MMNRPKIKRDRSENDPEGKSPLSRIHCPRQNILQTSYSHDEDIQSPSQNQSILTYCLTSINKKENAPADVAKPRETYSSYIKTENSNLHAMLNNSHDGSKTANPDESSSDSDDSEAPDTPSSRSIMDDLSYFEFSELQLKLRAPLMSPRVQENENIKVAAGESFQESVPVASNTVQTATNAAVTEWDMDNFPGSSDVPRAADSSFQPTVIEWENFAGSSDVSHTAGSSVQPTVTEWDLNKFPGSSVVPHAAESSFQPVSFSEVLHQQPVLLQPRDIHEPDMLLHQVRNEPRKLENAYEQNLAEISADDKCSEMFTTPPPYYSTVSRSPATSKSYYEPANLYEASSSAYCPLVLREAQPPIELVLHPTKLPQTILQPGPRITDFSKANSFKSVYQEGNSKCSAAPPSYAETMKDMADVNQKLLYSFEPPSPHIQKPIYPLSYREDLDAISLYRPRINMSSKPFKKSPYCISSRTNFMRTALEYGPHIEEEENLNMLRRRRWESPPTDHQLLAFISCLFCWPIGLVAIYYSNMCHMLKSEGEYEQARAYARLAFKASVIGLCSGSVAYILMLLYEKTV